jgi:hypothetical protein
MENEIKSKKKYDNALYGFVAIVAKTPIERMNDINGAIDELAKNYDVIFRTQSMRYLIVEEKKVSEDSF